MKRQILWSFRGIPEDEVIRYFFVIVNDNREISGIENKIFQRLAPIMELEKKSGNANGLFYKLLVFNSQKMLSRSELVKIYGGKWRKDRRVYERSRNGIEGLEDYVVGEISKI